MFVFFNIKYFINLHNVSFTSEISVIRDGGGVQQAGIYHKSYIWHPALSNQTTSAVWRWSSLFPLVLHQQNSNKSWWRCKTSLTQGRDQSIATQLMPNGCNPVSVNASRSKSEAHLPTWNYRKPLAARSSSVQLFQCWFLWLLLMFLYLIISVYWKLWSSPLNKDTMLFFGRVFRY